MNAKDIAHRLEDCAFDEERGRGYWDAEKAESIIAAALAEKDAKIARLEDEARSAKVRSNQYAKRLAAAGYDDVIWFGLPLWPPDAPKEVQP